MNLLFKIAFRNVLRNLRRSALTSSAVAVGAMTMLVFGAFTTYLFAGLHTTLVQRIGHLTVFQRGYFLFGAGNPSAYGIGNYAEVMKLIGNDPVLKPLINVITPTQSLVGIAGNFEGTNSAAKTFFGVGLIPSDRDRMRKWNEYHAGRVWGPDVRLADGDDSRGLVGGGVARILGLCAPLKLANCVSPPPAAAELASAATPPSPALVELARRDLAGSDPGGSDGMPRIDLLAATALGAPNVVSLNVAGADLQGQKESDDSYVAMHLSLAQQLVYGRGEHKVTGIVLQLRRSEDLAAARARLTALIQQHGLDLEVHDFAELTPFYGQVVRVFSAIFLFITVVMGLIVLFAVVNTMTMNVMERTNEIGTTRAMGMRRRGIRRQFLVEGSMLGAIGATVGAVLAYVVVILVNRASLTWIPPGNVYPNPLKLDLMGKPMLLVGAWVGLVVVATVAALVPASRAAKLPVVDALRHV
jgi:putative ABC transport system permease protein